MIITLIAMTAGLSLLHYTGTEHWLVYLVNQPIEYHLGAIGVLIFIKLGRVLYNFYPVIVGLYRSVNRMTSKLEQVASVLEKSSSDSPFKNGQKRSISTSTHRLLPGGAKSAPLQGKVTAGSKEIDNAPKGFNLLESIRTKYVVATKMVPLTEKIGNLLHIPFTMNNILSMGRVTNLAWRIKLTKDFLSFVLKYNKHHGISATVKWLKAQHVCLQKALGLDILKSTVVLGTIFHYSRLAGGGLPRIIPAQCRARIRRGDIHEIRFWSGLFNLYRILKSPGEIKISTIVDPFNGDEDYLKALCNSVKDYYRNFFGLLPGFKRIEKSDLSPQGWVLSRSASPSNSRSSAGILTDIWYLNKYSPELWQELLYYLYAAKPKVTEFVRDMQIGYQLVTRLVNLPQKTVALDGRELYQPDHVMVKNSIRIHGLTGDGVSQFAIKEEPAGKIRLFALLDSVTQSVLAPLHQSLFDLLRSIPNDGTFDQDQSVRRGMEKAIKANKAFSFDLTAATDRIPAKLTASLIGMIYQNMDLAESWLAIMTKRDFYFNDKVAAKLKVKEGPYRYACGQPMGGLSSWAGLAITHHWIVQLAAEQAGKPNNIWNEDYEILGDDLVIFDEKIADEYLKIMKLLGCEINMNKSICSPTRPVFEFAKRTVWGANIVSGISLAQIRAGWRVGGRVANALSFVTSGLLPKPSLLAIALSRYPFLNGKAASSLVRKDRRAAKLLSLGVLSLFGALTRNGQLPLKTLMLALVNPHYEDSDYSGEAVGLPLKATLQIAHGLLVNHTVPEVPFSKMDTREEVFDEYFPELITITLQKALAKAKSLWERQDTLVSKFASAMYFPYVDAVSGKAVELAVLPPEVRILYSQVENFANRILGMEFNKDNDPEVLYDTLYQLAYEHAKRNHVTFEEASLWLDRIEALEYKLTITEKAPPGKTILESAPILATLRNMDPTRVVKVSYYDVPKFQETVFAGN